jgi:hypothetical protein
VSGKLPLLAAYALGGLLLALWPLALRAASPQPAAARSTAMPLVLAAAFSGLALGGLLPWWRREQSWWPALSVPEAILIVVVAALGAWALLRDGNPCSRAAKQWQDAAFAGSAALLSFCTLPFAHEGVLQFAWHHWSAYTGPTELMMAGAHPLRDFPVQYGMGPTMLLAAGCSATCWTWMSFAAGLTSLAFAIGIAWLSLRAAGPLGAAQRGFVLVACLVCCFAWNAYPALLATPAMTPSVGGLRFLPVVALACLLVGMDRPDRPFPAWAGHAAWAVAALWSIESAFYATCLWWPVFLLAQRRAAPLLAVAAAWLAACAAAYALAFGGLPTWRGIFAYVTDPPGAMPVNASGTVGYWVAAMALGICASVQAFRRQGNTPAARNGLVLLLLAYSTFSYFLGRSHDNNVLNLLAFVLPVLLYAMARFAGMARGLAIGLLAALPAWAATANLAAWQAGAGGAWFDARWIEQALPSNDPSQAAFPPDTRQVIARARSLSPDPVTVLGPYANASSTAVADVWSALHSPANLHVLRPPARREFLERTAAALQRSGWLLVQTSVPEAVALVKDFDATYRRTHQFEMAGYLAIHYSP